MENEDRAYGFTPHFYLWISDDAICFSKLKFCGGSWCLLLLRLVYCSGYESVNASSLFFNAKIKIFCLRFGETVASLFFLS